MAKKKGSGKTPSARPVPQLDLFKDAPKFYAVIPIDREPILAQWRERYRTLERELEELSRKNEEYQFEAVPAFQAWVARTFGEELSGIRELEEHLRENELILVATLQESRDGDISESEAYRIVLLRKENGEDLFAPAAGDDDWDEGWAEVDPEEDYRAEKRAEEKTDKPDPDETSREYFRERKTAEESAAAVADTARLKLLYRKLAFALHPDANPNQSSRERKIWDEVQIAYAEKDIERLEMLQAWIESGSEGWLDRMTHAGTLRTLVIEKIAEVRASHQSFARFRREDSWKYWMARESEEKLGELVVKFEEDVLRDFLRLKRRLREFEIQFHRWRNGPTERPRKSARKRGRR